MSPAIDWSEVPEGSRQQTLSFVSVLCRSLGHVTGYSRPHHSTLIIDVDGFSGMHTTICHAAVAILFHSAWEQQRSDEDQCPDLQCPEI